MKALTIWQPWAQLIVRGTKTIETRGWATQYRGPLAIHAGQKIAPPAPGLPEVPDAPKGALVGVVWLADCVPMTHAGEEGAIRTLDVDDNGSLWLVEPQTDEEATEGPPEWREITDQAPLGDFRPGRWAWMLDDPIEFAVPVDARGQQGLWDCDALLDA